MEIQTKFSAHFIYLLFSRVGEWKHRAPLNLVLYKVIPERTRENGRGVWPGMIWNGQK